MFVNGAPFSKIDFNVPFISEINSYTLASSICKAMKYILVTGGVISGVGKGVLASSIGTILKAGGIRVTSIKIDPYINIDAGTFSPYEHGLPFFDMFIAKLIYEG